MMNWFIYIVNFYLLYCIHISSANIEIESFRIVAETKVTHHHNKPSNINFTTRVQNNESATNVNISFYASQSSLHVYFNHSDYENCYLGGLNVTIDNGSSIIEHSVKLEFPDMACCEMAASLCISIDSLYNVDEYCLAYGHDVNNNEAAGYKDCTGLDGFAVIYIISIICVICGFLLFMVVVVIVYVSCRRSKVKEDNTDCAMVPLDAQQRVSIDLKRKNYSHSFADPDTELPFQTNLPSMESFLFGSCSSLPQPEERLPQEFLSAFMKKYVDFVTEWNKSMHKGKTVPSSANSETSSKASPVAIQIQQPPRDRRISIKRRKGKGVSAVYVNQWDSTMEIPRERIKLVEKVGEGQFGEVHKAILQHENSSMTVAVKRLKKGTNMDDRNNFLRELATHALLESHPHVIKLIGCCIEKEPMLVIFEYMAKGNLLEYLKESPESVPSALNYAVTFGHHVAKGMAFLAATEIIHRDLAARNILINQSGICKVADFGFAKDVFGVTKYTKKLQTAPIRWMAPESLLDGVFSTQSDVWSFGVMLWEIITLGREIPYFDIRSIDIKRKIKEGVRLRKPGHCPTDLYALMEICWKVEPDERTTFDQLCKEFVDLERLGHYTPGAIASHVRKPSKLRGLVNRITRQLSSGDTM